MITSTKESNEVLESNALSSLNEISIPQSRHHTASIIFISFVLLLAGVNVVFADHGSVEVIIPVGTAVQGCETVSKCYDPSEITIDVGDEIVWSNNDSASHTVTSIDANGNPDGIFDSGLFLSGQTFSHTFDDSGEFLYFCAVHSWMEGIVYVNSSAINDEPSNDDLVLSCGIGTTYDPSTNACILETPRASNVPMTVKLTFSESIVEATVLVNDPMFDCGDLYVTVYDVSDGQKTAYQQKPFFDQCYGNSGTLPLNKQFSAELDDGQYVIEAQLFDKNGDVFLMVSQKFSVQDGIVANTDKPEVSCGGGDATYDSANNTCTLPTSQAGIQSTNSDALSIKEKFETSAREIIFVAPNQDYLDDFKEFVGEDKYERWQKTNESIITKMIVHANYDGRTFSHPSEIFDFMVSGNIDLTLEEETVLVESMEASLEFLKQTTARQLAQISNLVDDAKTAINNLDISDEEKSQHIREITDRKEYYERVHTVAVSQIILHSQEKLDQMKSKLQIKSGLVAKQSEPKCGEGTVEKDGICVAKTNGCLIATAAYGTELAPQVQMLREIREDVLFSTGSGTTFMVGFNEFYYSFSPTIADWERQSPLFKEVVKTTITPMLSTLSILNYVDIDSEQKMLGYGISVILLNAGIYFIVPTLVIIKLKQKSK